MLTGVGQEVNDKRDQQTKWNNLGTAGHSSEYLIVKMSMVLSKLSLQDMKFLFSRPRLSKQSEAVLTIYL